MTTSPGGVLPERKPASDTFHYLFATFCGAAAAWVDIKVGDLLLTATIVVASCMLLGFLRPRKPWRWVLIIGIFDLLTAGKIALSDPAWQSYAPEVYIVLAIVYFVFCFAMSKYSRGLEREFSRAKQR